MSYKNGLIIMGRSLAIFVTLTAGFIFTGCGSLEPVDSTQTPRASSAPSQIPANDPLRVGDTVKLDFSGLERQLPSLEEQIKEDGTISPDLIGSIQAANKTSGQLQKELNEAYKKYYKNLTVTVRTSDRFYYVGGEVKQPNRQLYLGGVTVVKAIQSAGDFTDFANKKKVRIIRANGKVETVNCVKARKNPKLDLPIYPGDTIHVEKSIF
ncbi:MAG: polysaccharide biosynthesis/export family protein [Verrucomicrobiota bacterium]|nr:polysaccharide biosynthesis/export family protein [Verrucomicrobiota bacterium]